MATSCLTAVKAVRYLDASGVDIFQDSELSDRFLEVCRGLGGVR
jgi:hypothetical protein